MKWSVPKSWVGETCVILAGGPSLRDFDASRLGDFACRVITINDSWRIYPQADLLYFCDRTWWIEQEQTNRSSRTGAVSFHELKDVGFWVKGGWEGFEGHPRVHTLRFTGQCGFEADPGGLRHGSNSGYQAIHLAAHAGVRRIVLLGYDLHCPNGVTHWHDGPREKAAQFERTLAHSFIPLFPHLIRPLEERGIQVLNATPGSALTCWQQQSLEEIFR